MLVIPIAFVAQWYLSLFSQTFFVHRYSAHAMFTMSKFWERFFFIFTFITQGSNYLSAYGFAHKIGYRTFDMPNTSTNFLPVDVLMMGESYHNNHHRHDLNPNFGHRCYEIDPTFLIKMLDWLKIIRLKPVYS